MKNAQLPYCIGFSMIPGIGRVRLAQLEHHFQSLSDAWIASAGELKKAGLDTVTVHSIIENRTHIDPTDEMEKLDRLDIQAFTWQDEGYPARLREIADYPPVLFVQGDILPDDEWCIAVVGTRKASAYGKQVTEELVSELARNSITVVSGLARGIDTVAHRTALNAGGRTLSVFACGTDVVYPPENRALARQIQENGALISEYAPGTRPRAEYFPRRNRILSGLSLGVLVVEADESSGAIITANLALEQNREVFAVPGSILSPVSRGTNHLIQDGAKLVRTCADILEELNIEETARQMEFTELLPADETETLLLEQIGIEPMHIDEICHGSGLPAATVSSTLTLMELKGLVKQLTAMNYIRTKATRIQ